MMMDLANQQKGLWQGCHLRVLCIGALNVEEWKTGRKQQHSLLFVDVVQSHITENVCQGTVEYLDCLYAFYFCIFDSCHDFQ